jgi:acetylornithine deacetylase/succinyl-diaminopimelate desuccinylase family protein
MKEITRAKIMDAVAKDEKEILEFTKELIAVATENPPGAHYKSCVEKIKNKLSEIGLDHEVIEVPNQVPGNKAETYPRYCILSSFGTGKNTLYFHGHYDVVPASDDGQFHPFVKNGNLYGRGSSDMKSGLTAMIYAVKAIKTSGIELNGKIGLTIVPDEETGGVRGAKYLADIGVLGKNGIGMLLPEPTSGVIWNANRGAISLRITVKGKPAHVCLHFQGINAFDNMHVVVSKLLKLKKEVELRTTNYHIKPDLARHSILMMGGQTKGGSNFNTVPGDCSFTIDRRINPEEDLEIEKQRLLTLLEELKKNGIEMEIEVLQQGESMGVSKDHSIAQTLAGNIEAITGRRPEFEMCPGLLETRFYAKKGIPAFAYGPGLLSVSHGPGEYVSVNNIVTCTAIYALTALDVLSNGEKKQT